MLSCASRYLAALLWASALAGCGADAGPPDAPAVDAAADGSGDVGLDTAQLPADVGPDAPADTGPPPQVPWTDERPWVQPAANPCPTQPPADNPLAELLGAIGLDLGVGITKAQIAKFGGAIASDPQRLPHFHPVQEDLDGLGGCWADNLSRAADAAVQSDHPMTSLLAVVAHSLGRQPSVGGVLPEVAAEAPLATALADLHGVFGAEFDAVAVQSQLAEVPVEVQRVAARVVLASALAVGFRNAWLDGIGSPNRRKAWFSLGAGMLFATTGGAVDPDTKSDGPIFLLDARTDLLFRAALVMMQALDEGGLAQAKSAKPFLFSATTPIGRVVLRGGADDTWNPKDPDTKGDLLLAIDTGGNDTWLVRGGANTSVDNPIAVAIDLGGDDTYTYAPATDPKPWEGVLPPDEDSRTVAQAGHAPWSLSTQSRQGAGRLGVGVLVDLGGGKDHYRALRMSQGYANFGVGVLWDDGGDDRYEGEAGVQGAAVIGIAIAYDGGGNDTRWAVSKSQGFAWISSGGLLYDRAGNDDYLCAIDKPLQYPSPQTPGYANSSLCQGTAFGFRRDSNNAHRSGGIALLRDLAGHDGYTGSTFVQGTGYWFGTGILADGGGNDHYDGLFYAQGAAAHFALAFFLDGGGDDEHGLRLKPIHSQMGLGHDFSSALFVSEGGDDIYRGPSRSQGAAKCHGHGLFVDNGGADYYEVDNDKAIGWATDYDGSPGTCGKYEVIPSWAFFVDIGGSDLYAKPGKQPPKSGAYADNQTWVTDDPDEPKAKEQSGGIDVPKGDTGLHVGK
ncbi:MAG: hypothetical protein FJ100_04910 [Deltaproteobacteria bacterium]|nr:hypothetical protein [Deltaproteobacteria bacterium]